MSCSTVEEDNDSCGFDALDLDGVYLPGLERPVAWEGRVCPETDSEKGTWEDLNRASS